jgi:hypothetical protein
MKTSCNAGAGDEALAAYGQAKRSERFFCWTQTKRSLIIRLVVKPSLIIVSDCETIASRVNDDEQVMMRER